MASAAARLSSTSRCPYTSFVIEVDVCPRISETACSGVPCATRVPQLVRVPVTEARALGELGEGVREVVRVHRRPDLAREDQPMIPSEATGRDLRLGLAGAERPEPGHDLWREDQRPA